MFSSPLVLAWRNSKGKATHSDGEAEQIQDRDLPAAQSGNAVLQWPGREGSMQRLYALGVLELVRR